MPTVLQAVGFYIELPRHAAARGGGVTRYLHPPAGDISHSLYFIKRGIVPLERSSGKPFARLSGGACFGAMHVVLEQRLLFSAIVSTDCELLVLSREDLNEAARQSPEFFCILQSLGKSSALRGMLREGVDSTPQVQRWSPSSNKLRGDRLRSDPHVQPSLCGSTLLSMVRELASSSDLSPALLRHVK